MSREIKFRAWCDTKKEFVNPTYNNAELNDIFQLPFYNLQQYTGLKDKNGLEIYEGDIVKVKNKGYDVSESIVLWGKKSHSWSLKCNVISENKHAPKIKYYSLGNSNDIEIIGNIHENPELLNQPI